MSATVHLFTAVASILSPPFRGGTGL